MIGQSIYTVRDEKGRIIHESTSLLYSMAKLNSLSDAVTLHCQHNASGVKCPLCAYRMLPDVQEASRNDDLGKVVPPTLTQVSSFNGEPLNALQGLVCYTKWRM